MRFEASLQGVDLDKAVKEKQGYQTINTVDGKTMEVGPDFMFKDPKEYEHLSQEERVELTKKMMRMHQKAFGGR